MALWYPQMGGYVGHALAVADEDCVDVYVWHDGAFPFDAEGHCGWCDRPQSPAKLHFCQPEQFIRFGQALEGFP